MAYEKQIELLERLVFKTKAGEVEWKRTAEDSVFQIVLRKNTIKIRRTVTRNNASESYIIEMVDSSGEIADAFGDADLDQEVFNKVDQGYYRLMQDLYEISRRQAFGADKILNEILKDLS